jgi:hypothetical protein
MGRPLKIKNTLTTDIGFNAFNQLTVPIIPGALTSSQFLGVVGGGFPGGVATATYPTVECAAYFTDGSGELPAYIITQKGATKYLVAGNNAIADGSFIVGQSYAINLVGTTNWAAVGAGVNPQIGDVFTATTVGGAGTGTAASTCVATLVDPAGGGLTTPGTMVINITTGGNTIPVSKLTNKFVWDYDTPANRYATNFFVAAGTTAKSGAEIDTWTNGTGNLDLAEVNDYTS